MKKYLYLVAIALVSCGAVLSSCSDDKITGDSIFSTKAVEPSTSGCTRTTPCLII